MQRICLTISDDPENRRVDKRVSRCAAIRAESAIRQLEDSFPPLRFAVSHDSELIWLRAEALVIDRPLPQSFGRELTRALADTGTRLDPQAEQIL